MIFGQKVAANTVSARTSIDVTPSLVSPKMPLSPIKSSNRTYNNSVQVVNKSAANDPMLIP